MAKNTNRVASAIAYVAALGLATGVSADNWELDVENPVTYAQEIFGGDDVAGMDLTLHPDDASTLTTREGTHIVLTLHLDDGVTAGVNSEAEVTIALENAVFGQVVQWNDIDVAGDLDKVDGSQEGGRSQESSVTVAVEATADIPAPAGGGATAASIRLYVGSLEKATVLADGDPVTAGATVRITGGPQANFPVAVQLGVAAGADGVLGTGDDVLTTTDAIAKTKLALEFEADDGDDGLAGAGILDARAQISLEDRTMLAAGADVELATVNITAGTQVEADGETVFADGDGSEADIDITITGALRDTDAVYVDLNADQVIDDGEAIDITEGVGWGSFRLADVPSGTMIRYVPDGETPMKRGEFSTSFAVNYDAESAIDPAPVSASANTYYAGVDTEARAYAIPNAGTTNDIANVRFTCESAGSAACTVFLDCNGQDGEAYFGELGSTIAAGATTVLQAEAIGEVLDIDAWAGRLSCDVLSGNDVSVQVLVRSGGSLINNTYVDGQPAP